jgi:hypothetical protein
LIGALCAFLSLAKLPGSHETASGGHIFLFMQHGLAAGLARLRSFLFCRDYMNFITTGAHFDRANTIRASLPQHRRNQLSQQPYAFLSARDLRGIVAAMVD